MHSGNSWGSGAAGLDVVDRRAYVTSPEDGLSIVDLSGADAHEVGYAFDYSGTGVAAVDRYAYVVGPDMWVVDVSDPAAPKLVSSVEVLDDADGVVRSGALLLVTLADPGAVQAYDISDPARPRHVGTYGGADGSRGRPRRSAPPRQRHGRPHDPQGCAVRKALCTMARRHCRDLSDGSKHDGGSETARQLKRIGCPAPQCPDLRRVKPGVRTACREPVAAADSVARPPYTHLVIRGDHKATLPFLHHLRGEDRRDPVDEGAAAGGALPERYGTAGRHRGRWSAPNVRRTGGGRLMAIVLRPSPPNPHRAGGCLADRSASRCLVHPLRTSRPSK